MNPGVVRWLVGAIGCVGMAALLVACESYRQTTTCRNGVCTTSTLTGEAADVDPVNLCPLVDIKVECDKGGQCKRTKQVDPNCSKDGMRKMLLEAVGAGKASDDAFRAQVAKDRDAIEQYPPVKARSFVREYLAHGKNRKDKRTLNGLVPEFEYLRDYATRKLGPLDHDTLATTHFLAVVYRDTGAFDKAEPLFNQNLQQRERALGPSHRDTAETVADLAALYRLTGAYGKARPRLIQALNLRTRILGATHPETAESMNDLAGYYLFEREYTKAEPLLVRARAILDQLNKGTWDVRVASVLHNLADLYRATARYDNAEAMYKATLEYYAVDTGGRMGDTRIASAARDLADLYVNGHGSLKPSPSQLDELLEMALTTYRQTLGDDHPETARTLSLMAEAAWKKGDKAAARRHMARALQIHEASTARQVLYGSDERRRQYLATRSLDTEINDSLRDDTPEGRAIGAAAVLQVKGRALDASADAFGRERNQLDKRDQPLMDRLERVAAERSALWLAALNQLNSDVVRQRLDELSKEQERLEADLSARSAGFRRVLEPVTLHSVQQTIAGTDALIEWIRFLPRISGAGQGTTWGAPRYAAYLITRSTAPELIDLGPVAEVDALVGRWQRTLRDVTQDAYSDEARQLYQRICQPLVERLAKLDMPPTRLLLSPDGSMNLVPFAALVDGQGRYLGDRYELGYLSSGRDLLRIAGPSAPPRDGFTVVAGPDYGALTDRTTLAYAASTRTVRSADLDRSGLYFNALPGTVKEARLIKGLFKLDDRHVLTADAATEARVKQLHGPRVLHIATHGFFLQDLPRADAGGGASRGVVEDGDEPAPPKEQAHAMKPPASGSVAGRPVDDALLRSGLALAGANARNASGGEDGILTAAEAARLDLVGTQLVVLSACETGSGEIDSREGVYGLRRAIELAGAQSQLVSLWKVNDEATSQLMALYYERLKSGEGRAQALRTAQQALRKNPARAHPVFWAAFIPIGDWRPLAMQ
jgi:CHAT domain-containing protein